MGGIREHGLLLALVLVATAGTFAFVAGATRGKVAMSARPEPFVPEPAGRGEAAPRDPFAWTLIPTQATVRGRPVLFAAGACMDPRGMIHYSFLDTGHDRRPAAYASCASQSYPGLPFTTTPHIERRWFLLGVGW